MSQTLRCRSCSHPITFHGSGTTRCRALGCECKKWRGPTLLAGTTISVGEVARQIGKSSKFVTEHAVALGGRLVDPSDLGKRSGKPVWRFNPDKVEGKFQRLQARLSKKK